MEVMFGTQAFLAEAQCAIREGEEGERVPVTRSVERRHWSRQAGRPLHSIAIPTMMQLSHVQHHNRIAAT